MIINFRKSPMNKASFQKLKELEPDECKALYEKYKVSLYSICRRYASNEGDAQDMMQEGFIAIFDSINKYKFQGSFEGYIKRVFINTVLQFVRKNYQQLYKTESWNQLNHDSEINSAAISNLNYEELLSYIQNLPEGYRIVFNMYAIDGYKHGEIANVLGIKESTSRSQYTRAKQILQKKIFESEKININE